jgi:hypothetical protein
MQRDKFYDFICRAKFVQGWIAPAQPAEWFATALVVFR